MNPLCIETLDSSSPPLVEACVTLLCNTFASPELYGTRRLAEALDQPSPGRPGRQELAMNLFNADFELVDKAFEDNLKRGIATVAGLLIFSGTLLYLQGLSLPA